MVLIKGPLGEVDFPLPSNRFFIAGSGRTLLTTFRSLNSGVSVGFYSKLLLNGVGFRVFRSGRLLLFDLGYSNLSVYTLPESVFALHRKSTLLLFSPSASVLGVVRSQLTALRPVDSYKGKGVVVVGTPVKGLKKRKKDGK